MFVYLWQNCDKYNEQRGSLKTWLSCVAKSKAIDRSRQLSKMNELSLNDEIVIEDITLIDNKITIETKQEIVAAINALTEPDREIIVRRYYYQQKPQEIGFILDMPVKMEQQADGSVELREVDLINQPHIWGGYIDSENIYLNVRLKCEGENIKSVDFFTEDAFFAKQYIKTENGKIITENVPMFYVGESYTLAMYGTDFEIVGNKLTLA